MHDQASRLRNLVKRSLWPADNGAPALPRVLTIAGGKSGVGATTVATHLAAAIAQQGWRTVLIDADRRHPQAALRLNLAGKTTLADVLEGRCSIHEALVAGPGGLLVVAGQAADESDPTPTPPLSTFTNLLASLTPHADLVVLDAGSAADDWGKTLWNEAERVLLVTGADSAAIMETYATLKSIWRRGMGAAVQVLVNLADEAAIAADVHGRLDRSSRRFLGLALEPGAALPQSSALQATLTPRPLVGGDLPPPVGPVFDRLAEALVHPAVALSSRPAA